MRLERRGLQAVVRLEREDLRRHRRKGDGMMRSWRWQHLLVGVLKKRTLQRCSSQVWGWWWRLGKHPSLAHRVLVLIGWVLLLAGCWW